MSNDEQSSGEGGFERALPSDIMAEQCVLGGMLLSKEAITQVVEIVRSNDFYRPAHQTVYDSIIDLFSRGEPVDAVSVNAELTKRGEATRVGGAPYLHTLTEAVPTAANAGYYARIVADRAVLRRLVEVGTRIAQIGYAGDGEVDDLVDRAQAEIYRVAEKRTGEDYLPLSEIMPGALDEIEAISAHDGSMTGVPTGFTDFDALSNGLHPGQMIIIAARPAVGKALALDTPLPTPHGWTTMGEVRTGDLLLAADGTPTRVSAATEVMTGRPCFELTFDDGTVLVADAEHQWRTETGGPRAYAAASAVGDETGPGARPTAAVRTTRDLADSLHTTDDHVVHTVRNAEPLALPERALPLAPYVLGAWLGAGEPGAARITTGDPELVLRLEAEGLALHPAAAGAAGHELRFPVEDDPDATGVHAALDALGLLGHRHVPPAYLRASAAQRRALLAGLLDSAASPVGGGAVRFTTAEPALAEGVRELLRGLGHAPLTPAEDRADTPPARHTVDFSTSDDVFRLEHRRLLHKEHVRARPPAAAARVVTAVRAVPSVPVRCVEVEHPEHLYLAGRSMVPTHNSTLALDFARAASIKHQLTSVFFSLEMGRNEIVMRLLSAEARVPLHTMRSGLMTDDDWTRLARRMGEVASAPLFIDDSPNMSMMEIRAKCRRLKQQHDLKLVVVDYLQLMSSGGRVESRQQEVSEFSRSLKLLAKELEVPVIALSQLNRGPEQRTDKKPQVSDLRESGCLTADTRVLRADTGAETTLGDLFASGARDVPVWSLDERCKLVPSTMTHVFSSGVKETFRLRMRSGRQVTASANHPFLTFDGWKALGDLAPGVRLAVPQTVPDPQAEAAWPEPEITMLAHLIGDGSFVKRRPIRYASSDEANISAVTEAAAHFGITPKRDDHPAARVATVRLPAPHRLARGRRNPIAAWLDGLGLFGLRSHEKFVPEGVFGLPRHQVALFLRHLWATDGCVHAGGESGTVRVYYASTSRRLVDDVARLLLRFGIMARIKEVRKGDHRPGYQLHIYGADHQRRFFDEIGVHGARGETARLCRARLADVRANTNVDTVPVEVWERVRLHLAESRVSHREFAAAMSTKFSGTAMGKRAPSCARLGRVAHVLDRADLELVASNDVFWDEIDRIEPLGEQEVFDATVTGTHNFVANGISVHNSIEQDADMVILLYREDVHEKESPRAGEADLIVAKHRNGPTATVTVAFQGHYSRFVDMAPG